MKVYQERWCDRLETATTADEVLKVVEEIVEDDTGGCDLLASMLAGAIMRSTLYETQD